MISNVRRIVTSISSGFIDLIYPSFCVICEKTDDYFLCAKCIEKMNLLLEIRVCQKCGAPFENPPCIYCKDRTYTFESARSAGIFEGNLREAIHTLKYGPQIALAAPLANLMSRCFPRIGLAGKADVVIPVPIHRSRQVERGFNQAEELAKCFCARISLPLVTNVLIKHKRTKHQVDLPMEHRMQNLKGAFAVTNTTALRDKRVLLVDDVFTTGSTLNEAAQCLRDAGALEVHAYTLSRSL